MRTADLVVIDVGLNFTFEGESGGPGSRLVMAQPIFSFVSTKFPIHGNFILRPGKTVLKANFRPHMWKLMSVKLQQALTFLKHSLQMGSVVCHLVLILFSCIVLRRRQCSDEVKTDPQGLTENITVLAKIIQNSKHKQIMSAFNQVVEMFCFFVEGL